MKLNLISLKECSIFEQLLLEEKLLRENDQNWCILNYGSSQSIVMGISGKVEELIDIAKAKAANIPLIKRFSGGGTVVVDENTLFVTFMFNSQEFPFQPFPEPIHRFAADFYKGVFTDLPFAFRENDYVLEDKKFGGNAQYIQRHRWLHHTSFLWDYNPENMDLLLLPKKAPAYRSGRKHSDFLCKLNDFMPSKEFFFDQLIQKLEKTFSLTRVPLSDTLSQTSSRISTQLIAL